MGSEGTVARNEYPLRARRSADHEVGEYRVEIKAGVHAVSGLRNALVEVAYAVVEEPSTKWLLVLLDPAITAERVSAELARARTVMVPAILDRLTVVIADESGYASALGRLDPGLEQALDAAAAAARASRAHRLPRPDFGFIISQILILSWLRGEGPLTADWICNAAGCTYRTFASAIRPLAGFLRRHSDRRYELARFPREEWARMVANAGTARQTIRYADRSGQPRSPEDLLRRHARIDQRPGEALAVGGVLGALHHYPELDLGGAPRLDLTIHCPTSAPDLSFIEQLDPGLTRVDDSGQPARLAIHLLRRALPLIDVEERPHAWADPVECLLDLHEARLDVQAEQFLNHLLTRRKENGRG